MERWHGQLRHLTSLMGYPALSLCAVCKTEGEVAGGGVQIQRR
jgi:hypothetical protein